MSSANFAALLETFFTDRLIAQRRVSPHTVASYRDTFRLLLQFAQKELGKSPSKLAMTDLNTTLIGAFLDNLEKARANSSRSRNLRLTAIRSFFRYTAMECPEHSAGIQRVLAIPPKRQSSRLVDFLTRPEIEALVAAPDQTTWLGRRDRGLLLFAIQTGLRVSELIGLRQGTSTWVAVPTSVAKVKGESSAALRLLGRRYRFSGHGCANRGGTKPNSFSPALSVGN
jgi:integrase/recombinase XerD